ncbi:MAG: LPS assembly protein LptD [Planctomycetota bacterium]|jgi:hypothetical protein
MRIEYERITVDPDSGTLYLADTVRIHSADMDLRADRVIVWSPGVGPGKSAEALRQPAEIYAEGNVRYVRGGRTFRAEALYYDFETGKAYLTDIRTTAPFKVIGKTVTLRAERLRGVAKGKLVAENIRLSTCEYGDPHYDVYVVSALMEGTKESENPGPYEVWPYDEWRMTASSIIPRFQGVPFFWFPVYSVLYPDMQDFPIRSVRGGRTDRFGVFAYVDWGRKVSKGFVDSLNPSDPGDPGDDERKWGDVVLETDWRQERGGALGLDLKWEWTGYHGYVDTYFLHDDGRSGDSDFDDKFPPLSREERGRARAFHRHDVSDEWRYELEASYISDRDLLEEFFRKEFHEGKEQETLAYLRFRDGNIGAFALERHRLNDFQTQLEYLPRVEAHLVSQPLFPEILDLVTLSSEVQLSQVRLRYDEELDKTADDMWRLDAYGELRAPLDAEYAVVTPFAGFRGTLFHEDVNGDTQFRRLFSVGARASAVAHGVHDVTWDLVGLRRLRHVVQAEAGYTTNSLEEGGEEDVLPFELVDDLGRFEEASFILRQRFETKTEKGETREFLRIDGAVEYYPNPIRDTRALRNDNFLPPFHWIPLAPGETGGYADRHWSNIHWEAELRPANLFYALAHGEYNPEDDREEVRVLQAGANPDRRLSLSFSQTLVRDVSNTVTGAVVWRPSEKWTLSGSMTYDYEREEHVWRRIVVGRDLHDFILEAYFERNEVRDDTRFYVTFVPKFLGTRARRTAMDVRGEETR